MTWLGRLVATCAAGAILASCATSPDVLSAEEAYQRGTELARDGEPAQARRHFEHVLAVEPAHDAARAALARTLARDGQRPRAWATVEEGLRAHPDSPDLLRARGDLHADDGAHDRALADYLAAARQAPGDLRLRDRVIDTRLRLGQAASARQALQLDCERDVRRVGRCPPGTLSRLAQVTLLQGDPVASSALWAEVSRHEILEGRILLWKYAADRRHLGDDAARAALRAHERLVPPGLWRDWVRAVLQGHLPPPVPPTDGRQCEAAALAAQLNLPMTSLAPAAAAADPCARSPLLAALRDQHRAARASVPGG